MKNVRDCWCIQIDVTNMCEKKCSNCTHLVKCAKPWKMDMDTFRKAIDSLSGFPNVVGIIGGNPMLHPNIFEMIGYLQFKVNRDQRGIWISTFGNDGRIEGVIREVFTGQHIYYNDHNKTNWHQPLLVASKDLVPDPVERQRYIDNCWLAEMWSPSITPNGCYRCEVMGALDNALNLNLGLPVESGWWKKPLCDFEHQVEAFCHRCGLCVPMERRMDSDQVDDFSESNKDIAIPERSKPYDIAGYDQNRVINWFPCEYRIRTDKPWGLTVSVGYGECLDKILPYNMRHLEKAFVVTVSSDEKTKAVCAKYPNITVIETDLFYRHDAKFNKGAAVELATWLLPKDQWCLIFDSDIMFPADCFLLEKLDRNHLYGASRSLVYEEAQLARALKRRNFDTEGLEVVDLGPIGAFQLFNTSAEVLGVRPWYGINYNNASWCDNIFQFKWHPHMRHTLPIKTLHLGDRHNWVGEVEGTFPRSNTPFEKVKEIDVLPGVTVETMLLEVWDELRRIEKHLAQ